MMRLIVICFLIAVSATAEMIHWIGSFDAALEMSQARNRPMLVLLVKRACPSCRNLLATALRDEAVVSVVNARTVPVIVTKENEDYPIELLYTLEFPTLFLLTPDETFLAEPLRGEIDAPLLWRWLEEKFPYER